MASTTTWGGSDKSGYDMSLWYDSRPLKVGWFAMLGAVGAEVVFQRVFGYSHGLDSMTPEFETVWMGLWRFNVISSSSRRPPWAGSGKRAIATSPMWIRRPS